MNLISPQWDSIPKRRWLTANNEADFPESACLEMIDDIGTFFLAPTKWWMFKYGPKWTKEMIEAAELRAKDLIEFFENGSR